MPGSANRLIRHADQSGPPQKTVDHDAVVRLAARLVDLDLDVATLELLLAALTADEATTTEPALPIPTASERRG